MKKRWQTRETNANLETFMKIEVPERKCTSASTLRETVGIVVRVRMHEDPAHFRIKSVVA
jgi:hypothetical protein